MHKPAAYAIVVSGFAFVKLSRAETSAKLQKIQMKNQNEQALIQKDNE